MSRQFRSSRSVRLAAAGGVLGVAAAVAGLGATGAAQADTGDTVTSASPHTLVITLDQDLADSLRAAILEALAAAQQRTDEARAKAMKGGSPTGLAHSRRWHATVAHAGHPPAFAKAGTDDSADDTGTGGPVVSGTDDDADEPDGDGYKSDGDGYDGHRRHCDRDGDHRDGGWGDRSDGDHRDGDWGDRSDGDHSNGDHSNGGWGHRSGGGHRHGGWGDHDGGDHDGR
jgi:hypothetical protein